MEFREGYVALLRQNAKLHSVLSRILELDGACEALKRSPMSPQFMRSVSEIELLTNEAGSLAADEYGGLPEEWSAWLSYNIQSMRAELAQPPSLKARYREVLEDGERYDPESFRPGSEWYDPGDDDPPRCRSCSSEEITFHRVNGRRCWSCLKCGRHSHNPAAYDPATAVAPPGCATVSVITLVAGAVLTLAAERVFCLLSF